MSEEIRSKVMEMKTRAEGFKNPGVNPHKFYNKFAGLIMALEWFEMGHEEKALNAISSLIRDINILTRINVSLVSMGIYLK